MESITINDKSLAISLWLILQSDIIVEILLKMNLNEILKCIPISKKWQSVIEDNHFWYQKFLLDFPNIKSNTNDNFRIYYKWEFYIDSSFDILDKCLRNGSSEYISNEKFIQHLHQAIRKVGPLIWTDLNSCFDNLFIDWAEKDGDSDDDNHHKLSIRLAINTSFNRSIWVCCNPDRILEQLIYCKEKLKDLEFDRDSYKEFERKSKQKLEIKKLKKTRQELEIEKLKKNRLLPISYMQIELLNKKLVLTESQISTIEISISKFKRSLKNCEEYFEQT